MTALTPEAVGAALKGLTKAQRYHVSRGSISGDFTMQTVRALIAKGLMYLRIDSPNGQCGFVENTELGNAVRELLSRDQSHA